MKPVLTAQQMRAVDDATIHSVGLPRTVLMEMAGRRVAEAVGRLRPFGGVVVVCGLGNNGGDGFVAARVLRDSGRKVSVVLAGELSRLTGDAAVFARAYTNCGGVIVEYRDAAEDIAELAKSAVIVDALFGTGLTRELGGLHRTLVERMNEAPAAIIAVDIPSGVDADTGQERGIAVRAMHTVSLACLQPGVLLAPEFSGTVELAEIGIPHAVIAAAPPRQYQVEAADVATKLPSVGTRDHKNTRGHVLALAGSPGTYGAGRLAGEAALRSGCGLVTLLGAQADPSGPAPIMTGSWQDSATLSDALSRADALAIGPGMSISDAAYEVVVQMLASPLPAIVDADALTLLAGDISKLRRSAPTIITPHPGEAARLLQSSSSQVQADRPHTAKTLVARTGATLILKGAPSLIAGHDYIVYNTTGNPGLATAGSGDVLSGVVASLLAQGCSAKDAALVGAYCHGLAGDHAAETKGTRGLIASDIVDHLPIALKTVAGES